MLAPPDALSPRTPNFKSCNFQRQRDKILKTFDFGVFFMQDHEDLLRDILGRVL
jgi:hypothetical protein